ncbi:MAG: bifunctional metallophosphatase/5'-nucleotidase [Deltaproteobacteria bacterium]|nr:bifunctional metallophosphatase/5'-nucleotidase [Deltaproteobacteria bacterium]
MRRVVLLALTLFAAPAFAGEPVVLTIVGTSDTHGRMAQLPIFASYMKALRATHGDKGVVLIDAGDAFQGTLESDLDEGESVTAAFSAIGYDAMAVGNHEFDYGPVGPETTGRKKGGDPRGALLARSKQARFPMLAANVACKQAGCGVEAFPPDVIVEKIAGMKVGIVGVTSEATLHTTIAANVADLEVRPIAATIATRAKSLRERGANIVIVAAHAGGHCKGFIGPKSLSTCDEKGEIFEAARALPAGLVDAIIAGHTHQAIAHTVNGIAIIQSYSGLKAFGRIDLTIDPETKKITAALLHAPEGLRAKAIYEGGEITAEAAIATIIAPALARADTRKRQTLGPTLAHALERRYAEESALGNFVASQMLALMPAADVAIMNGGGMRADLPAGPLTYGAIYQALPFDNRFALVTLTGKDLARTFARNLHTDNGFLSIAGAKIEARCDEQHLSVRIRLDKGKELGDEDKVVVATNDFLATGGDDAWKGGDVRIMEDQASIRDQIADRLRVAKVALDARAWFDRGAPRISAPSSRPVRCGRAARQ